jgi:transcriptional regulator with XRE-family HTH domain
MFFGHEHLGKAVAFLRDSHGVDQVELAEKLGITPNSLSLYERGRRGMKEDLLKRISEALNLNPIQIWDTAYRMFRYNYFLEWAAVEGVTVEELIDRVEVQPSIEKILESHQSKMEHEGHFIDLTLRFMRSLGNTGLESHNLLKVVVEPRSKRRSGDKAVRFDPDRKTSRKSP